MTTSLGPFSDCYPASDLERVRAAAHLERSADILERDGWCREIAQRTDGHRCLVGALATARIEGRVPDRIEALAYASVALEVGRMEGAPNGWDHSPIAWNDRQTDKRRVTRLLRRTAKGLLS